MAQQIDEREAHCDHEASRPQTCRPHDAGWLGVCREYRKYFLVLRQPRKLSLVNDVKADSTEFLQEIIL